MDSMLIDKEPYSLDCGPDGCSVAVCGKNLLNIYDFGSGKFKMRLSSGYDQKRAMTYQDISWNQVDNTLIALGTSTTHVIVKTLSTSKLNTFLNYENRVERSVSSLSFHPRKKDLLLVSARDEIILLDLRQPETVMKIKYKNGVQKISWNPHRETQFAACLENSIEVVDLSAQSNYSTTSKAEKFLGHDGPVFCCDWHPVKPDTLASGGRDCYIKVWNVTESRQSKHSIKFFLPVDCIKWRPCADDHIVSAASTFDQNILCWNIHRPFLPSHSFGGHSRKVSKFCFYDKTADAFLSVGGDKTLRHHDFKNAIIPETCTVPNFVKYAVYDDVVDVNLEEKTGSECSIIKDFDVESEVNPFEYCLQGYDLNASEPVLSCKHNAETAAKCSQGNISEIWMLLSKLFPKSQRSSMKSRSVASNVDRHVPRKHAGSIDMKQNVSAKPRISEGHNFSETSTEASDVDWGSFKHQNFSQLSLGNSARKKDGFTSSVLYDAYNVQHELTEKKLTLSVGQEEDSQNETDEDVRFAYIIESVPIIVRPEGQSQSAHSNQQVTTSIPPITPKQLMKFLCSLLRTVTDQSGQVQLAISAVIVLQNEIKLPDLAGPDPFADGEVLLSFKEWLLSYHKLLTDQGFFVEACNVTVKFPISHLREKVGKFERYFCKKHCDEKCKYGCDVCTDPIIDRHSNMQLKLSSTCCGASFNNRRCTKCLRCARCSYCKQAVKSLFAWCQGCGHGGHLNHMHSWFSQHTVCLVPSCGHKCEFS